MLKWLFLTLLSMASLAMAAPNISLGVSSQSVAQGEALTFQIKISGATDIEQPQFPATEDWSVRAFQPSRQQSTQITYINGRMQRVENNDVSYNFQLIAKRTGELFIPAVTVAVDGKKYRTSPVKISVGKGDSYDELALEFQFSSAECYVGQPIVATWRWYIGREVSAYDFDLPAFSTESLEVLPYQENIVASKQSSYKRVGNFNGNDVIGQLKRGRRNGIDTVYLEFSRPFLPTRAGELLVEAGRVTCEVVDNSARRRRNSFFDDFFDRASTKTVSIGGGQCRLVVKELPHEGRPEDFSGIIGQCSIALQATPLEVNVGDPIVASLTLRGLPYPSAARIGEISRQKALAKHFRVSDEDSGQLKGNEKVWQFTLRALSADVAEIPHLAISYFNVATGKYEYAVSKSVPIKVHSVKKVTAAEAIGAPAGISGKELQAAEYGIAQNAPWEHMLTDRLAGPATWRLGNWRVAMVAILALATLLQGVARLLWLRMTADTPQARSRRLAEKAAGAILSSSSLSNDEIFEQFQEYLRGRCGLPAGPVSFSDVRPWIEKRVSSQEAAQIEKLFKAMEAIRYGGGGAADLRQEARNAIKALQK